MTTAIGLWFTRPQTIDFRKESLPEIAPGTIHVAAQASAISHGTEMLVYRGQVAEDLALDLPTLKGSFRFPIKYGYASVGTVKACGEGVTRIGEGDSVFVYHPHQTEYVVPATTAIKLPPTLPMEHGLFLANLETAVNVFLDAPVRMGETVVIVGQGVIGLLLTQLALRNGAGRVIAIEPIRRRRELSKQLGAHVALHPEEHVVRRVMDITEGRGADLVVEASGNGTGLRLAIEMIALEGTVVVCSWYGTKPMYVSLGGRFHRGRLRLKSSQVTNISPALQPRWTRERRLGVVLDLLPQLRLEELVSHRLPFARAASAYRLVDQSPEETVQVVLTYAQPGRGDAVT